MHEKGAHIEQQGGQIHLRASLIAAFLAIAGMAHAQINTPGQGDSMQRPVDSMQAPVAPGKPFAKGTTPGEEAERKNHFDRNQEEANKGHKLDTGSSDGSGQGSDPARATRVVDIDVSLFCNSSVL